MTEDGGKSVDTKVPLPLGGSTLEDLVSALLVGRKISQGEGVVPFVLANENSRKLFAHYAEHRDLWPRSRQVQAREIEDLLEALAKRAPEKTLKRQAGTTTPKLWKLRRLEAHRFGGLHRHCGPDGQAPEPFVLEVDRDLTLIHGFNGAGKTALQSAIIWCLTNRALRSQQMPDEVHEPMEIWWRGGSDADGDIEGEREIFIPPIVPIPSATDLETLNDEPKTDTWVQLTFHAEKTGESCQVRRELVTRARGRISVDVRGLDELGVSTLAIDAGTLMPGIASNMRFDEKTTFAQAIAELTGLKPLEDLGHRSQRVIKRLKIDEVRKTETTKTDKLAQFNTQKQAIVDAWGTQPDLGKPMSLYGPHEESKDLDCETSIISARRHLEGVRHGLEAAAEIILGRRLELGTRQDVDNMLRALTEADDLLRSNALNGLSSMVTMRNVAAIGEEDRNAAEKLCNGVVERARVVSDRLENEQEAARWQLYTRVAAWHKEHHPDTEFVNCPVCGTDLEKVPADALLNTGIKEALRQCREADADVAKNAKEWEQDTAREFLDRLPESLRIFTDKTSPVTLIEGYKSVYVDELLKQQSFSNRLQPIKKNAEAVWEIAAEANPLPDAPERTILSLPKKFEVGTIATRLTNVLCAIQLSKHRQVSIESIKKLLKRYVGTPDNGEGNDARGGTDETSADQAPLRSQIRSVRKSVENAAPAISLLRQLDELDKTRKEWEADRNRLVLLDQAATALEPFLNFPALVHEQVSGLIQALGDGIETWLAKLYSPHYHGGPSYSGFDPAEERGVGLRAGIDGMQVPAHQIMNASLLRACVWAFLFSLWEHIRERAGGLDCFLLDDPQMHFDPINAENLAAVIPLLPDHGMRPIITTHDTRFLGAIRDKLPRRSTEKPSWAALLINPVSSSRLTACVSPSVEEIYERKTEWQDDENNVQKAQEFVERVRLHVENGLWDLLASDPMVMQKPTLADLLQALRRARNNGECPFDEPPFEKFLSHSALRNSALFYRIINKAHHRLHDITPHHAGEVSSVFDEIDRLLRSCSASYARFMGRLTREDKDLFLVDLPPAPQPVDLGTSVIPVLSEISALSSVHTLAVSDRVETITLRTLGDVALFGIRGPSLGTFALPGQVVIASLNNEARNGDPVIALRGNKIFARRYCADRQHPSRFALTCDLSGTENVPPALMLPRARVRVLPIIGVLYDQATFTGQDEACVVEGCRILRKKLLAARVVDDSAYPVIRNGDIVLLEATENPRSDEFHSLEGEIVVFIASRLGDSFGYLKRLGSEYQPGIRIFENVGLNGSALAVSVAGSREETTGDVLCLEQLWHVHGVLRTAGTSD